MARRDGPGGSQGAMYAPQRYRALDAREVEAEVRRQGFDPLLIQDPPGRQYPPHRHATQKLVVVLGGSMRVSVEGQTYQCRPGDSILVQGNAEHWAVVGPEGCTFFWSERL